jgi:hypothetical protein
MISANDFLSGSSFGIALAYSYYGIIAILGGLKKISFLLDIIRS